jgi:Flp pilus assembly protein TadD
LLEPCIAWNGCSWAVTRTILPACPRDYAATRRAISLRCLRAGRVEDAEAQWQQVLTEQPRFQPALGGLADVCLVRKDGPALEAVIARLQSFKEAAVEIEVLRARLHQVLGEFAVAKQMLERIIALHPREFSPWVVLSQVLLQEGLDMAAAERALRAALEINPQHAVTLQNLAVLLREKDRKAG